MGQPLGSRCRALYRLRHLAHDLACRLVGPQAEIDRVTHLTAFGGVSRGKGPSIARLAVIADDYEILRFDTSGLIAHEDRAAVEIPVRYRHRETGASLETTIANFWTFEDGWPVARGVPRHRPDTHLQQDGRRAQQPQGQHLAGGRGLRVRPAGRSSPARFVTDIRIKTGRPLR